MTRSLLTSIFRGFIHYTLLSVWSVHVWFSRSIFYRLRSHGAGTLGRLNVLNTAPNPPAAGDPRAIPCDARKRSARFARDIAVGRSRSHELLRRGMGLRVDHPRGIVADVRIGRCSTGHESKLQPLKGSSASFARFISPHGCRGTAH